MSPGVATVAKVAWVLALVGAVAGFAATRLRSPVRPHLIEVEPEVFSRFNEGGVLFGRGADTVIVFSRYTCQYCAAMLSNLDSTLTVRPDAFTIRLRHFAPPASDSVAFLAGVAANCAAKQGRFREISRWLTSNFVDFESPLGRSVPTVIDLADSASFFQCTASNEAQFEVFNDVLAAVQLRVTGTPTSLVRGYRINGFASSDELSQLIRRR